MCLWQGVDSRGDGRWRRGARADLRVVESYGNGHRQRGRRSGVCPSRSLRRRRRCGSPPARGGGSRASADSGGLGFVAVRIVPWLWNLPPNDGRYYPFFAACVELGIPFCTQIDHTGPLCPSEPGRPIPYLDDVLLEFPDLVVVGGHVGYPWIDEVISLAIKYPNFYIDTSAYAVHRLPAQLLDYMRGRGRIRVMFGTNWPMLSAGRCLRQLSEVDFDRETSALFLGENAARVFKLTSAADTHRYPT